MHAHKGETIQWICADPVFINLSFAKGDCLLSVLHRQASSLRFAPHPGHIPLQSSLQSTFTGKRQKDLLGYELIHFDHLAVKEFIYEFIRFEFLFFSSRASVASATR